MKSLDQSWRCSPISFEHASLWCLFFNPNCTAHHSNIGVPFQTRHWRTPHILWMSSDLPPYLLVHWVTSHHVQWTTKALMFITFIYYLGWGFDGVIDKNGSSTLVLDSGRDLMNFRVQVFMQYVGCRLVLHFVFRKLISMLNWTRSCQCGYDTWQISSKTLSIFCLTRHHPTVSFYMSSCLGH